MNVRPSEQGGPLEQLVRWLAQRNAAPAGPRPAAQTSTAVPAAANVPGLWQIPGLTTVSGPAGVTPPPTGPGLGAPVIVPVVAAPSGLGLRVDALA